MRRTRRLAVCGTLLVLLVGCSADEEGTSPPPATQASASSSSGADGHEATSAAPTAESVPQVYESALLIDELDGLVGRTGLDCGSSEGSTSETHSTRMCEQVLLAVFSDVSPMDGYVNGYLQRGNSVVVGTNWFVTGTPARIEPLLEGLEGR